MSPFEPQFVIKVCGITREQDLAVALDAGANAIGFNFYEKSPRFLRPENAYQLRTPRGCLRVGVFVHATREHLLRVAEEAELDVVQLHGRMNPLPEGLRTWRSLPVNLSVPDADTNERIEAYLLDTPTPEFGGSGRTFDWSIARGFSHRMILAGGLDAENVGDAIAAVHPWGVDACSRLESAPGVKDAERVRAFVRNALQASEILLKQEVSL